MMAIVFDFASHGGLICSCIYCPDLYGIEDSQFFDTAFDVLCLGE